MVWGLNTAALALMEASSTKVGSGDQKGEGPGQRYSLYL